VAQKLDDLIDKLDTTYVRKDVYEAEKGRLTDRVVEVEETVTELAKAREESRDGLTKGLIYPVVATLTGSGITGLITFYLVHKN
jgi:hypothetical protein